MLTRRLLLQATAATALLAWSPAFAQQVTVGTAAATSLVQNLGTQLVTIVNAPGPSAPKAAALTPIIESSVDVDGIGHFCLGRFWRLATPQQQQDYLHLFHRVLIGNITSRLGEFRGVRFTMTNTVERDGTTLVGTIIRRPNQEPVTVQWVVASVDGQPRIVDVIAEGTSLRLTQRSDYSSFVAQHNNSVAALIVAMRMMTGS